MERKTKQKLIMKKEKMKLSKKHSAKGITLIALVITIVVLLILAGITINYVMSDNGILKKATDATNVYEKEKSREELTLVLSEVQLAKHAQGLTGESYDEKLNSAVNAIGKIDNDKATVSGHIWQIDRSVPRIIDYVGEDDGIEIKYTITGNDTYTKTAKKITANITVKNNKGVLDTSSIKITQKVGNGNETDITSSTTISSNGSEGTFELITEDTEETIFEVSAKNSEGNQSTPRTIKIVPKIDTTAPTLSNPTAVAEGVKIKIKVNAEDTQSGVEKIYYKVSPTTVTVKNEEGTEVSASSGTIKNGEELILTAAEITEYTVTFTAEDKAGNSSEEVSAPKVKTRDVITLEEAKELTYETYPKYIGKQVIDYKSDDTVPWRVFYVSSDSGGFVSDKRELYLIRDPDPLLMYDTSNTPAELGDEGKRLFVQLNPNWGSTSNGLPTNLTTHNHMVALSLCDVKGEQWSRFYTDSTEWVIGGPSFYMFLSAYYREFPRKQAPSGDGCKCRFLLLLR